MPATIAHINKQIERRFRRQVIWHEVKAGRLRMAACIWLLPDGYVLQASSEKIERLAKKQRAAYARDVS